MSHENKKNLHFFTAYSMLELYECMRNWQEMNKLRFLSANIQQDGGKFCCIALTNPTEVVITSADGKYHAEVYKNGVLSVG